MTHTESGYYVQSSSPLDSALFFVLAAFILNIIVVFNVRVLRRDKNGAKTRWKIPQLSGPLSTVALKLKEKLLSSRLMHCIIM
ncbi:hypothetical protein ANCDUO_19737 [Ancylostoma duodenale]|uniref:Uncharacterized protein n=1 Tax=Ancylostoma duodenale TaxID=51022 RepID=A0A0C2FZB1_9BILA|nr:hypothetical protein ANCDUO_19737 [Ancylostoma duodenale]